MAQRKGKRQRRSSEAARGAHEVGRQMTQRTHTPKPKREEKHKGLRETNPQKYKALKDETEG